MTLAVHHIIYNLQVDMNNNSQLLLGMCSFQNSRMPSAIGYLPQSDLSSSFQSKCSQSDSESGISLLLAAFCCSLLFHVTRDLFLHCQCYFMVMAVINTDAMFLFKFYRTECYWHYNAHAKRVVQYCSKSKICQCSVFA